MSKRLKNTSELLTEPSVSFRLPHALRQAIEDAAWQRRISMGELLRRFSKDGLAKLERGKKSFSRCAPTATIETASSSATANPPTPESAVG
jgi:hypothetical protein